MMDRRSLEHRLAELESDDGTEDMEIIISDTVVETPWSADRDDREVLPAGTTQVRCYRDGSGAWTIEDGGG